MIIIGMIVTILTIDFQLISRTDSLHKYLLHRRKNLMESSQWILRIKLSNGIVDWQAFWKLIIKLLTILQKDTELMGSKFMTNLIHSSLKDNLGMVDKRYLLTNFLD